jgi:hypothetical protein
MANSITASEGYYQDRLINSQIFLTILRAQLIKVALVVKAEALSTPQHALRSSYASLVLQNTDTYTRNAAPLIVASGNLLNTITVTDGIAITSANESAIFSQVSSSWTILAGGDTGA